MSAVFRIILVLASLATLIYISRKLKKAQVDTHDTIFWLVFCFLLILLSIFPDIANVVSNILGIYSTVNTVFLIIIFALLIRVFLLTIKISQMEHKIRVLVEELAIREKKEAGELTKLEKSTRRKSEKE
ncbi:DUF2304 domain-containing protein [Ruminococcus sp. CLA-AA-H200]|uniref:DUF2304 domain-containing protein n=1 Tax=Ruminococcus turbiniformis TaxID=2881258 RepID=A0ABS8FYW5_9FIRM|nr:DUF2304 domain-containing protein [Ruminococcus turbiniformis]MCC2255250.1 DUF2304 domain-containing protein [Ruminococcus turbiniformis]